VNLLGVFQMDAEINNNICVDMKSKFKNSASPSIFGNTPDVIRSGQNRFHPNVVVYTGILCNLNE
jgi:hypothetical protein